MVTYYLYVKFVKKMQHKCCNFLEIGIIAMIQINRFNQGNWNSCQYTNQGLKAIISLGASPGILDSEFYYYVTVLDEENNEMFQEEFPDIDAACNSINNKYADLWDFIDLSQNQSTSGCGSCTAH